MNREQAVKATRELLQVRAFEANRLDALASVVRPSWLWGSELVPPVANVTQVPVPDDCNPSMRRMTSRSETNFLPLVLDTFSQVMKVDNYLSGEAEGETASAWQWWQRNQMDARQTGLHRSTLHYGAAYNVVLPAMTPGQKQSSNEVYFYPASPRQLTAVYGERMVWNPAQGGPIDDDWPIMALEISGSMIRLYDEQSVHFIGVKQQPHSTLGWRDQLYSAPNNFEYIEGRKHGVGVCPVVRYRDRVLLDGEEQFGLIEPLLTIQARINETTFGMLVAQYFAAFKQRYIIGWIPRSEAEALKMKVNDTWTFADEAVKVGQFDETDLTRYIESKKSGLMDMSAIGQLAPHALGLDSISNVSEATLAALEMSHTRKSSEIMTSLGESHEQLLRLAAFIAGDDAGASDFGSEVKWADWSARTFAQTVDGLGKLGEMLHIPDEILWEDIPGWTKAKVDRARKARAEADTLTQLLTPQQPSQEPAAAPEAPAAARNGQSAG